MTDWLQDIRISGLENLNGAICNLGITRLKNGNYKLHIIIDDVEDFDLTPREATHESTIPRR